MVRTPWASCLTLLAVITALGCIVPVPIPGRERVSPEVRGRIIDGKTKNPVPGVEVKVVTWRGSGEGKRPATRTDNEGRFHLPADKHFYLVAFATPCPVYHFPATGEHSYTLVVSHPDYETLQVNLLDYLLTSQKNSLPDIGDIEIVTKQ